MSFFPLPAFSGADDDLLLLEFSYTHGGKLPRAKYLQQLVQPSQWQLLLQTI